MIRNLLIVTSIALLVTVLPLPYFYYQILRWLVCTTLIILYVNSNKTGEQSPLIVWIIIAIIFNPVSPIHFPKSLWLIIDIATAGYFSSLWFKK